MAAGEAGARPPVLIGWCETLDFPEWHLRRVRVKVDTGACTSALGVVGYELHPGGPAGLTAHLRLALHRRRPHHIVEAHAPVVRLARVRNTGGGAEERPVIEAVIQLGPVRKAIQLTLTQRRGMRFPILLGRQALKGSFIVDVSRHNVQRG